MKFTVAWSEVLRENNALKVTSVCLAVTTLVLGMGLLKSALKAPLIVERTCYSHALNPVSPEHTPQEIEAFIKDAMSQRFDTVTQPAPGFLSAGEITARITEQRELDSRKLMQRVLVNKISIDGQLIKVDADRLISVEAIRSVLPFPLTAEIASVTRSESNPYGLTLVSVASAKPGEKNVQSQIG